MRIPALLMSQWTGRSPTASARRATPAGSATSTPATTSTPSASSAGDELRQAASTRSPRSFAKRASASPIPRLAPVMTVFFMSCGEVEVALGLVRIHGNRGQDPRVPQVRDGLQICARAIQNQRVALAVLQLRETTVCQYAAPALAEERVALRLDRDLIFAAGAQIEERV